MEVYNFVSEKTKTDNYYSAEDSAEGRAAFKSVMLLTKTAAILALDENQEYQFTL